MNPFASRSTFMYGAGSSPKSRKANSVSPDVIVRQLEQVDRHHGHQGHRPGPVVLVQLDQGPFVVGPPATGPNGGTPRSSGVLWLSTKNAPSVWRSLPTVKISYSVLRGTITWVESTWIGPRPGSANDAARFATGATNASRTQSVSGKRDVEVLGEHHVRQLGERPVRMRVARVPAASGDVDPAAEPDAQVDRLVFDRELLSLEVVLLAPLGRQGVAARRKLDDERVG